jgi:hypothetical protein
MELIAAVTARSRSSNSMWPAPRSSLSSAHGIASTSRRAWERGVSRSCSPTRTCTGTCSSARRASKRSCRRRSAQNPLIDVAGVETSASTVSRPAARSAQQHDAPDAIGEQLGPVLGQCHDRHAAHRVTGQHQVAFGCHGVDDIGQVAGQCGDGGRARGSRRRTAVPTVVVAHDPDARAVHGLQIAHLITPAVLAQCPPVQQNDADGSVVRPAHAHLQVVAVGRTDVALRTHHSPSIMCHRHCHMHVADTCTCGHMPASGKRHLG